jgi:hypothetical protein
MGAWFTLSGAESSGKRGVAKYTLAKKESTLICCHGYRVATPLPGPMHFYPTSLRSY